MTNHEKTVKSLCTGLVGGLGLALLGVACSAADDAPPAEKKPSVADFDLTSTPSDFTGLEAAILEYDNAFNVDRKHPAVQARKQELVAINDELANVLARIEIGPGHVVKFYEPVEGVRMVGERYTGTQERVLKGLSESSFEAVYRKLKPGEEPPAALIEADRRATDPALASAPPPLLDQVTPEQAEPESQSIDKHATSSCTHFRTTDGGCPQGVAFEGDIPFCFCNNVGVARAFSHTAAHSAWLLGSYVGSVTLRLTYNGSSVLLNEVIDQGEHFGIQMFSGDGVGTRSSCTGCGWLVNCIWFSECLRDHRGEVLSVQSTDSYHFGGCTENDQSSSGDTFDCI